MTILPLRRRATGRHRTRNGRCWLDTYLSHRPATRYPGRRHRG